MEAARAARRINETVRKHNFYSRMVLAALSAALLLIAQTAHASETPTWAPTPDADDDASSDFILVFALFGPSCSVCGSHR